MAKLLVRVGDDASSDEFTDMKLLKDGDVVAVADDAHEWGKREIASPRFRDITLPGSRADYEYLLEEEPATVDEYYPKTMFQNRARFASLMKQSVVRNGSRRPRLHRLSGDDAVQRKQTETRKKRRQHDADRPD